MNSYPHYDRKAAGTKELNNVFVVTIIAFKKPLSFSLFQFFLDDINLERCFPDGKWTKVSIDKNEKCVEKQ